MEQDIKFRRINQDEFDSLKKLFPGDEETWKKYRSKSPGAGFIWQLTGWRKSIREKGLARSFLTMC